MGKHNIFVYNGLGACAESAINSINTIKQLVSKDYDVLPIGAKGIIKESWINNADLLVMPGGSAGVYEKHLTDAGISNISKYVSKGGKFFGICAAAYLGASHVEFAKGNIKLEVIAERGLKFYPGLASGPTYAGFGFGGANIFDGVRATKILWTNTEVLDDCTFKAFYNGGGYFEAAETLPNVTVLAKYYEELSDDKSAPVAIVECGFGKGKAILSGVHLEWNPLTQYKQSKMIKVQSELQVSNADRLNAMRHMLTRLGLSCSK